MGKTPTKAKPRRYTAVKHTECSKKRTLLKERIRALEARLEECESATTLSILQVDILHDVLKSVVETMGLESVLDPFGAGLTPAELEPVTNKKTPPV